MHWNVEQVLWALVLAGHLVLLIVLLGRDRIGRFPWFTAAIGLSAVHLIADHLLHGKLTTVAFYWESYSADLLGTVLGILVLAELARSVFSSGKEGLVLNARGYLGWTLVLAGVAAGAAWLMNPRVTWATLTAEPKQTALLLTIVSAIKSQQFLAVLTVAVGLPMFLFGRRFGAGFRSHARQILLGLSTNSLGLLAVQSIKYAIHPASRVEYDRDVKIFNRLDYARFALWILVLVWWIAWLWREEPGFQLTTAEAAMPVETAGPNAESLEAVQDEEPDGEAEFRD